MSTDDGLKEIELTQVYGGAMAAEMALTKESDTQKLKAHVPKYVIPVVFVHGIMAGNLRLSKEQQKALNTTQEFAWQPDSLLDGWGTMASIFEILAGFIGAGRLLEIGQAQRIMSSNSKERQINFDPAQVRIDTYCPDDDLMKFDTSGQADKRQSAIQNINIPPYLKNDLIKSDITKRKTKAEQKARWRGWGEAVFAKGAGYEVPLKELEFRLSNRMKNGKATKLWKKNGEEPSLLFTRDGSSYEWDPIVNKEEFDKKLEMLQILDKDPQTWNQPLAGHPMFSHKGPTEGPVTEDELKKLEDVFMPVHSLGYNWLQSNAKSGMDVAKRIEKLIAHYNEHTHMKCEHVIILSHSMGGYVTRAALHPAMGNLQDKVLGVYHNVMPTVGAAMTYRRMRTGTGSKGISGYGLNKVLGPTGEDVTAIMINAPAAIEMLPNIEYGMRYAESVGGTEGWVKVRLAGKVIGSFPESPATNPFDSIYSETEDKWWRLINPKWVNPAEQKGTLVNGQYGLLGAQEAFYRIMKAQDVLNQLWTVTPKNSFASYGANATSKLLAYGSVTWDVVGGVLPVGVSPNPRDWRLVADAESGDEITVEHNGQRFKLKIAALEDIGEEMVPSFSAAAVKTTRGKWVQQHYDHGCSYDFSNTLGAALYSLVKIANEAEYVKNPT
ncbi:esterase/lipase family protein [Hydromonas duriensis]|uniref:PGAP1-like protein n=1 Tax=Hydromonas duriensis TaxID=1527608 RepID=A0A4R6Y5S3_9BURK|nr:hypothetical protein [Hydromonas duriensis]TDR30682.1 hypothetical protein DFR44_11831 [Hydromonas duriensis]